MDEPLGVQFPPIDPSTFDLIVSGTGLTESIVAAAASAAGKSVLHLDANPFYGSYLSSLSLPEAISFLQNPQPLQVVSTTNSNYNPNSDSDYAVVDLCTRPLISNAEVSPIPADLERCGRFSLDMSGPRVLFCADSAVDLMMKSGICEYIEFKGVDASFICDPSHNGSGGSLARVPGSRSEVFKDRTLKLTEKRQLMAFFKLVQEHVSSTQADEAGRQERVDPVISPADLDTPFVHFLAKMRLPPKIKSIILYAIAMADNDQEDKDGCKPLLNTDDAISRLALYHSSIGRFANANSGMLYPMYGLGELPQAFCRRAAVKGCIYVLRMPLVAVLTDKDSGLYKGVKLGSGQHLYSEKLILDPSFVIQQSLSSSPLDEGRRHSGEHNLRWKAKVARGICITRRSIMPGNSNFLVVYPPRTLFPEQATSVRVLQIGSNLAVCPPGMFILYLSAHCEEASQGKMLVKAARKALCSFPEREDPEASSNESHGNSTLVQENEDLEGKPTLLWSTLYIQEVVEWQGSSGSVISTPSPDGNLSYNNIVNVALKLFHKSYPESELFPELTPSKDSEDQNAPAPPGETSSESTSLNDSNGQNSPTMSGETSSELIPSYDSEDQYTNANATTPAPALALVGETSLEWASSNESKDHYVPTPAASGETSFEYSEDQNAIVRVLAPPGETSPESTPSIISQNHNASLPVPTEENSFPSSAV